MCLLLVWWQEKAGRFFPFEQKVGAVGGASGEGAGEKERKQEVRGTCAVQLLQLIVLMPAFDGCCFLPELVVMHGGGGVHIGAAVIALKKAHIIGCEDCSLLLAAG